MATHLPVLLEPVLEWLLPEAGKGGILVDCTLGLGGHAKAMLEKAGKGARLIGLDQDPQAREIAAETLKPFGDQARIKEGNFRDLDRLIDDIPKPGADAVLMDLGVSSLQLDEPQRGFSFQKDGPLDMRMDPSQSLDAASWLNHARENEIEEVLRDYGEEKRARAISRAIVAARPLQRTSQLADAVCKVLGWPRHGEVHPATRSFQAVRLKVNQELEALEQALPMALALLKPGGRLGVISFHSLEDRIVKRWMERESKDCVCPPGLPACACGHRAALSRLVRKGVTAGEQEAAENPRARSARLRVAAKLEG